jgi:competence protein ComEC
VLVAVRPWLCRSSLRLRFVLTVGVLAAFATVTRFEPSVLRATTMAGVAAFGALAGRPAPAWHHLGVAVAILVLIDPLLVHALGFQLSVAASASILGLSGPLAARIPGPRPVAETLAVTVAAQVGVAPLLVGAFGGVPLAAVPANVAAAPAVAPLTIWGLSSRGGSCWWPDPGLARPCPCSTAEASPSPGWRASARSAAAALGVGEGRVPARPERAVGSARAPAPGPASPRHHHPGARHGDSQPHPGFVLRRGLVLRLRRLPAEG